MDLQITHTQLTSHHTSHFPSASRRAAASGAPARGGGERFYGQPIPRTDRSFSLALPS